MTQVMGSVRIAPEVLATIVHLTALGIPGVIAMAHVPGHSLLTRPRLETARGVRLTVHQNTVAVDLYVVVAQGTDMVGTGASIQRAVSEAVHDMLGMTVKDVNIYIQNVA